MPLTRQRSAEITLGRDLLVAHKYFAVDLNVVWSTATTKIDELEVAVRALLKQTDG